MYISLKYIDLARSEYPLEAIVQMDSIRYITRNNWAELRSGDLRAVLPCDYESYERELLPRIRQATLNGVKSVVCDGLCFLCSSKCDCDTAECPKRNAIVEYINSHEDDVTGKYSILW